MFVNLQGVGAFEQIPVHRLAPGGAITVTSPSVLRSFLKWLLNVKLPFDGFKEEILPLVSSVVTMACPLFEVVGRAIR